MLFRSRSWRWRCTNCWASSCHFSETGAKAMEILDNLAFGFSHALTTQNLLFCMAGCVIGTLVGLLPGLGPLATISLLLPLTYSLPPTGALIMLAGIYYGAQYGDNVSAITMKIPHAASIVACIDGYQMTLNGKTGLALLPQVSPASSGAPSPLSCWPGSRRRSASSPSCSDRGSIARWSCSASCA